MPLYDFRCGACETDFEAFVSSGTVIPCPACGGEDVRRVYGTFAGPFSVGLRGAAARRSNAQRQTREERRREEWQDGRQARERGEKPPQRKVDDTPWWRQVPGAP